MLGSKIVAYLFFNFLFIDFLSIKSQNNFWNNMLSHDFQCWF